jgi:hypothetical protein
LPAIFKSRSTLAPERSRRGDHEVEGGLNEAKELVSASLNERKKRTDYLKHIENDRQTKKWSQSMREISSKPSNQSRTGIVPIFIV